MVRTFKDLIKEQYDLFGRLTEFFTLDDWRSCRNENYWQSDKIENPLEKIRYKNKCVIEYLRIKNENRNESRN